MATFSRAIIAPWLASAAFLMLSCHSKSAPVAGSVPAASASSAPQQASDEQVARAVNEEIRKDPHIDSQELHVTVTRGVVDLSGATDNLLSKERATRVAEIVRGVRSVDNRLSVVTPARPDQVLERDVKAALQYSAATAHAPIRVSVSNGVVELTGSVGSWQEQRLAERIAEGVRGVRLTQNRLSTKRSTARKPEAITGDVESRLAWDVLVEHDPIRVSTTVDHVKLTGVVGSAAEKMRAVSDAWVDGVSVVDASDLTVDPTHRPDPNVATALAKTDQEIARAIQDATFHDPRVLSFNVVPNVVNGVVTLTGAVETVQAKRAAEALARNTVGVKRVDNQLVARSRQSVPDSTLQARIEESLVFDPLTNPTEIHVTVKNGQVVLSGSVATFFDSAEADDVASRLAGVNAVDNRLQVRDQVVPYVYSIWLDPFTPLVESWYVIDLHSVRSDTDLKDRIQAEFSSNPFVMPGDVTVRVEHGKAILSGRVGSERERRAAERSAIEGGALSLDDRLQVI